MELIFVKYLKYLLIMFCCIIGYYMLYIVFFFLIKDNLIWDMFVIKVNYIEWMIYR